MKRINNIGLKEDVLEKIKLTHTIRINRKTDNDAIECYILRNKRNKVLILRNTDTENVQVVQIDNLYNIFKSLKLVEVLAEDLESTIANNYYKRMPKGDLVIIRIKEY